MHPVLAKDADYGVYTDVTVENITKVVLLLVYSVVFSLISALCYTLMFILGGSTAGSDYLTIYWSQEKNKNIGGIFIIITSVSMILGISMGTYGAGALVGTNVGVNYAT
ncbi:hypothetical protein FACS1894218_3650 [Bacilli bacterium]|nr:hypothetical protein FACS1894218_3650 [Bacilli bacterium]